MTQLQDVLRRLRRFSNHPMSHASEVAPNAASGYVGCERAPNPTWVMLTCQKIIHFQFQKAWFTENERVLVSSRRVSPPLGSRHVGLFKRLKWAQHMQEATVFTAAASCFHQFSAGFLEKETSASRSFRRGVWTCPGSCGGWSWSSWRWKVWLWYQNSSHLHVSSKLRP